MLLLRQSRHLPLLFHILGSFPLIFQSCIHPTVDNSTLIQVTEGIFQGFSTSYPRGFPRSVSRVSKSVDKCGERRG
jgi:hypothetical protein